MPALITHHLFGAESMDLLAPELVAAEDEKVAFSIANQGPDPFFFRFRSLSAPKAVELAKRMHRSRMTRQLEALREGVARLPEQDAGVGRAFVLGLLSHYALDRVAHPFVYAQQWGIQAADEELAPCGSEVHAIIEGDIDLVMLGIKRNGATIADFAPIDALGSNGRVEKIAGALMGYMARRVYGIDLGAAEYGGAVHDMQLVYRLIEPAGSSISSVLSAGEGLVRNYSMLGSLAHRVTHDLPRGAANLDHRTWTDPFRAEDSDESFVDVFDRALGEYASASRSFVEGEDLSQVTRHINYSGRVLEADEEFDREE